MVDCDNNKILAVAGAVGAASSLIPIIRELVTREIDVHIIATDIAFQICKGKKLCSISQLEDTFSEENAIKYMEENKPCIIVSGAGGNNKIEPTFRRAAKKLGIFCFAFADMWCHPARRFFQVGSNGELIYSIPDLIGVSDERSYNEIIGDERFDSNKIVIVGMPHVEETVREVVAASDEEITHLFATYNLHKCITTFVFFSAPVEREIWDEIAGLPDIGYSETTILCRIIQTISQLCEQYKKPAQLIVKPHPSESSSFLAQALESTQMVDSLDCRIIENGNTKDMICMATAVLGMTSTALLEAALSNKPVFSVKIGLNHSYDDRYFNSIDGITSVYDLGSLRREIEDVLCERQLFRNHSVDLGKFQATNKIVNILLKYLSGVKQ